MTTQEIESVLPTPEEIALAAGVLQRLPRGYLPFEIFAAIAEKVAVPTMEVAPVRDNRLTGSLDVLLIQRPADDRYWPNAWHIPGTVIRSTDKEGSFITGYERVLQSELGGVVLPIGELTLVGVKFWDVARGRELDHLHYFETDVTDEDVISGKFFDVNDLPEGTLEKHRVMIAEIAAAFSQNQSH